MDKKLIKWVKRTGVSTLAIPAKVGQCRPCPDLPKKTALKMIKDEFFLFLLRNVSFVYINLNVGKTLHQQNVDNKFQKNSVLFVWHAKVSLGNTA